MIYKIYDYVGYVYLKAKHLAIKGYNRWLGEELTERQVKINQYLLAKRTMGYPLTEEDYHIDPIRNDRDLYEDTMAELSQFDQLPFNYTHLKNKSGLDLLNNVSRDLFGTSYHPYTLEPGKMDVLIDGQLVLAVDYWIDKLWEKSGLKEPLYPKSKIEDFIHNARVGIGYDNNNNRFYPYNKPSAKYLLHDSVKQEHLSTKWYSTSSYHINNSLDDSVSPFNHLDNYYLIYNYFLYKNAGINYLDYQSKNTNFISPLEKMLCYSSDNFYDIYFSNILKSNWDSVILKVLNLNYRDTFINPLYNFITNRSYSRTRHSRADPLSYAASLYRFKRRGSQHKGYIVGRPRVRDILYQNNIKHLMDVNKSNLNIIPRYKRARTATLHHSIVSKRAQVTRNIQDPVDHLPVDYTDKYPLFYDLFNYYLTKSKKSNPLSNFSYMGHADNRIERLTKDNVFIPDYSMRFGSRLSRKLGYLDKKIEADNNSTYIYYINHLQRYFNSDKSITVNSYPEIENLYSKLLSQLNSSEVHNLLSSYFFRKNYLSDLYHRFNFMNITSRVQGNLIRKNLITRNRYGMRTSPLYHSNEHNFTYVRLNNYDLNTRLKIELLSSFRIPTNYIPKIHHKLHLNYTFWDSLTDHSLSLVNLLIPVISSMSLIGFILFDFYINLELNIMNLFDSEILYPWLSPMVRNLESFWYSAQYFHFDFENLDNTFQNPYIRYSLDLTEDSLRKYSPHDQMKESLGNYLNLSSSVYISDPYVYGTNYFFNNQYMYYIYQSKNVLKLPYYPLYNSSIVYFQWDNLPLFNLTSHGFNTNLFRLVEQFTYNVFSRDISHLILLSIKDLSFNLTGQFDYSIFTYIYLSCATFCSYLYLFISIVLSFIVSTLSLWFIGFIFKAGVVHSFDVLSFFTNSITFLNIKHIFMDLPYWYIADLISSVLFHWQYWLIGTSNIFHLSNWIPYWYIYTFLDNYLKIYIMEYYYHYYSNMSMHPNNLFDYFFGYFSIAVYWTILIPFYYIMRFIFITIFVESYGLVILLGFFIYYYIHFWNISKNYSWLYRSINKHSIREWNKKYQVIHDKYINSFVSHTDLLLPYQKRSFSSNYDLISRIKNNWRQQYNNINIWRNPEISGYRKYPGWYKNYYNSPNIMDHLLGSDTANSNSISGDNSSDFYKHYVFSQEYLDLKQKTHIGLTKLPLFRSYPNHVQDYYRKSLYSSHTSKLPIQIFEKDSDYLYPFILLGKHFEDQNFITSFKSTTANFIEELSRGSISNNEIFYLRYYYLRKYFPFYARFQHSNYRMKNSIRRYRLNKDIWNHVHHHNTISKYLLWDGSSHSIYMLPGISSMSDEMLLDNIYHDPGIYKRNLTKYLSDTSFSYEDWLTDGSFPEGMTNLNLGLQHSEKILDGGFRIINAIERQRRIVYMLFCYQPGFNRFYPDRAYSRYRFKFRKQNLKLKEEEHLSDYDIYRVDKLHQYYYEHKQLVTKRNRLPTVRLTRPLTEYKWENYKSSLLWYVNELKHSNLKTKWVSDYDLGSKLENCNFEHSFYSNNFLYPIFYYYIPSTYNHSIAWYRIHKLHRLNTRYRNKITLNWELSTSWETDMSIVKPSEVTDSIYDINFSNTLAEIFDDEFINGKLIPYRFNINHSEIKKNILTVRGKRFKRYYNTVMYPEQITKQILMGKYYRYLYHKNAIDMQDVAYDLGKLFKLDFRSNPQNFYNNVHILGLTGRNDFLLEKISYDFDTGWVKLFNFIGYKKYKDQRTGMDARSRRLSMQSIRTISFEDYMKSINKLDSFGNASIYHSFLPEFQDFSTSIYYSWLSQQYSNNNADNSTNYFNNYKYNYLLGNFKLSQKYGYSSYAKILDLLRDTHNYIRFSEGSDNNPISLRSIENFYEYDRYTMTNHQLDIRWDIRILQGKKQANRVRGHKLYKHFRLTGPRQFQSSKHDLYKTQYKRRSGEKIPLIDSVNKLPGDTLYKQNSLLDLLSNRNTSELSDHNENLLSMNIEYIKMELKPILFYKVPKNLEVDWLQYQKEVTYYNNYDNSILNNLKQQYIYDSGGSWKYQYLKELLRTDEYNYIFEESLGNSLNDTFNYKLLERYCEHELTGAMMTKQYLIYREKIKSISPNASLFFQDFYPEYIWEYYEFNWYEEIKNDWFFIIPFFGLFALYYMGIPNDYYKFSRKRFKNTLYVHHINRRRKSGPKNAQRRIFAIPNRLKRKRLHFYRMQSKNNIIYSNVLNNRSNLRSKEYLYPYSTLNPIRSGYTSKSHLKNRTRFLRSKRLSHPRKIIFYDGYTIQLRMNRRRSRRAYRRRLHGLQKKTVYSNMKIMRGFDPYYTSKLKNEEVDSYIKLWKRKKVPKGTRKYQRVSNAYRRPYKKPYRRYYTLEFYKTMLLNDLLKLLMYFKSFFKLIVGIFKILFYHFTKYPITWNRFKDIIIYMYLNKFELFPGLGYIKNQVQLIVIPRIIYIITLLSFNTNAYTRPFGLGNRKKLRRYWRGKRRNYRDKLSVYSATYAIFFNYFLFPIYRNILKPIYKISSSVYKLEANILTKLYAASNVSNFKLKLQVLNRLVTSSVKFHSNYYFSKILLLLYSAFYLVINSLYNVLYYILFIVFKVVKPLILIILYVTLQLIHYSLLVLKPVMTLCNSSIYFVNLVIFPLKYLTSQLFISLNVLYNITKFIIILILMGIKLFIYTPVKLIVYFTFYKQYRLIFLFFNFYRTQISKLSNYTIKFLYYSSSSWNSFCNSFILPIKPYLMYINNIIVKPLIKFIYKCTYYSMSFILTNISYIFILYIEPIIYTTVKYSFKVCNIFNYYVHTKLTSVLYNIYSYINIHNIIYLIYFIVDLLFGFIKTLLTPLVALTCHIFTRVVYICLNSYAFIYFIIVLVLLMMASFLLNLSIILLFITSFTKFIIAFLSFYLFFAASFTAYITYFVLSPLVYIILTVTKIVIFFIVVIIKLFIIYLCSIVYLIFNIYHNYLQYIYDDNINLLQLIVNLFFNCLIDGLYTTYSHVFNYTYHMFIFIFKYYIPNNFNDVCAFHDYYANRASIEAYYGYLKSRHK